MFRFKSGVLLYKYNSGNVPTLRAEEGTGTVIVTVFVSSQIQCAAMCSVNEECAAAQYDTSTHVCLLLDSDGHTRSINGDSVFLLI